MVFKPCMLMHHKKLACVTPSDRQAPLALDRTRLACAETNREPVRRLQTGIVVHYNKQQCLFGSQVSPLFVNSSRMVCKSLFFGTSQLRVASQVRVTSQVRVRFQFFSVFFFSFFFFFDYTNDVRAVTRGKFLKKLWCCVGGSI